MNLNQMFLTQSNFLRHLTKSEYKMLREMCRYSNNLYNCAVYEVRQYFFKTNEYIPYEKYYHICKLNENYKLIQAGVAQQTLKVVERSFKSFFALLKLKREGKYNEKVRLPKYRKKGDIFNLVLSTNAITIHNGILTIPMSRTFSKQHKKAKIRIAVPERLKDKEFREIRIIPLYKGKHFKIQYSYKAEPEPKHLNKKNSISIDIGVDNLASCITNTGTSFIMDGRKIKSINRYWNKRKAKLQSIAARQGFHITEQIYNLTGKRNNRIDDYMKKTARYIINHCIANDIGTVVCGYNKDFKRNINLGKKNNQQFTQISFNKLFSAIKNLCERYDMTYIEQEESYTSKASFLDFDEIPVFNKNKKVDYQFSGKRIHRGLYRTKNGTLVNADINGACNILRKSKQNFKYEELCRGLLASPLRIKIN